MNAQEARKLTEENLRGPVIQPFLDRVYALISAAASSGQRSITDPLSGLRLYQKPGVEKAIYKALEGEGYTVTNHPDPDPGHPCSHPYTTVEW